MVGRCVKSRNLVNEEALAHWGAVVPNKKNALDVIVRKWIRVASIIGAIKMMKFQCSELLLRHLLSSCSCITTDKSRNDDMKTQIGAKNFNEFVG